VNIAKEGESNGMMKTTAWWRVLWHLSLTKYCHNDGIKKVVMERSHGLH